MKTKYILYKFSMLLPSPLRRALRSFFPQLARFVVPGIEILDARWLSERIKLEESFSHIEVVSHKNVYDFIFVSPLLPTDSGIAEIAAQMIASFSSYGRVAVVCAYLEPDSKLENDVFTPNCMGALVKQNPNAQILYVIANGKHYYRSIELLFDFPGTVLLHDVNISGIPNSSSYGTSDEFGLSQLSNAIKILVHSIHAKKLIEKTSTGKFYKVEVLPLGAPIRKISEATQPIESNTILISTIGYAEHSKDSVKVFNTFVDLATRNKDWEFAFVGRVYKDWLMNWQQKIKLLGLDDRIHFPGKVSDENLVQWIDRSSLCIQLRVQSNGESSGALMDIIGRFKPVIVSEIGSFVEIKNNAVYKVPVGTAQKTLVRLVEELILEKQIHSNKSLFHKTKRYAQSRSFDNWFKDLVLRLG
jgi:glycosyltransferase involved in cell wall biosynthesis